MTTLTVGQVLWYVPVREGGAYGRSRSIVVTKVGRVWANTDNGFRIRVETLTAYQGSVRITGALYLNESLAQEVGSRRQAWANFRYDVGRIWDPPAHMSTADIEALSSSLTGQVKT